VRAEDGTLLYYEGFVTDITQRKLAEEASQRAEAQLRAKAEQLKQTLTKLQQTQSQLIHNEKMCNLGQLVAGVAHEINNPVNFVCGNLIPATQYVDDLLDLLRLYAEYYPQPAPEIQARAEAIDLEFLVEDFPKTLSSMQLGADRIRQIVQSLRSFSRIDESHMTQVDIHKGIDSTLLIINNRLKPKGDNPGIAIVKEYGELPLVKGYAGLLNQVFMNLLCNAVDALEDCPPKLCAQTDFEEHYRAVNGNGSSDHQACSMGNRSGTPARRLGCVSVSDRETSAIRPAQLQPQPVPKKGTLCRCSPQWESPKVIRICTELIEEDARDEQTTEPRIVIRIIDNGPGMTEDVRSQSLTPSSPQNPSAKVRV
jgi:signal transduction histidine kinase